MAENILKWKNCCVMGGNRRHFNYKNVPRTWKHFVKCIIRSVTFEQELNRWSDTKPFFLLRYFLRQLCSRTECNALCLPRCGLEITRRCGLKIAILFLTLRGCSLSGLRSLLSNLSVYIQQNVEQPTFYREQETSKTRQLQIMIVSILQEWNTSELIASLFWHFQNNIFEQLQSLSSAFGHWSKFDILCCI